MRKIRSLHASNNLKALFHFKNDAAIYMITTGTYIQNNQHITRYINDKSLVRNLRNKKKDA